MGVRLNVTGPTQVEHDGKIIAVESDANGIRIVGSYRQETWIRGSNLKEFIARLEKLDEDARIKREKIKARKAAEKDPLPATWVRSGRRTRRKANPDFATEIIDIKVRGIDERNGNLLVLIDGDKDILPRTEVMRVLTDAERMDLTALLHDAHRAMAAVEKAPEAHTWYDIDRSSDSLEVAVSYRAETDEWVATHDGIEFVRSTPDNIRNAVVAHIARKRWPWHLDDGEIVPSSTIDSDASYDNGDLFATPEEAQQHHDAEVARGLAIRSLARFINGHLFDPSVFEDTEDADDED